MTITIFKNSTNMERIKLQEEQKIHITQNHLTIYHFEEGQSVDDRKIKFDVFQDTILISE